MRANEYSSHAPLWYAVVQVKAGEKVEYKFVKTRQGSGNRFWESGENRQLTVPAECGVFNETVTGVWEG